MRRAGILLTLLLTAAGLCGLWQALLQTEPPAAAPDADLPANAYRMLYERPLNTFEQMQVALADGEGYSVSSCMVYDANGHLLGVTSQLGQPLLVDGRGDFALDSAAWQMMLVAAQNLPVTASYDALDLDACGLSSPKARIEISYADGERIRLAIGNKTASGASCYVQMEGDGQVHLAPSDFFDVMTRPLKAHHALPGALNASVDNAGQAAVAGLETGSIIVTLNPQDGQLLPWTVESPIRHSASTERVEALIEGICAIRAEEYVATVYDVNGLAAYGLDTPVRLIASFYDGVIRDIHVGRDAGNGRVYVRMDSTGDIYLASREQLAFAEQASLDGLLDRFAALVPIQQLERVEIDLDGQTVRMEQLWQEGDKAVASGYVIDGENVTQQEFSAVYAQIIGLQFDKTADDVIQTGAERARIRFVMRDGTKQEIRIFQSSEHYDLIATDGGGRFLIRCERVNGMIRAIKGGQP